MILFNPFMTEVLILLCKSMNWFLYDREVRYETAFSVFIVQWTGLTLLEKCPDTEFFLVCIFSYSD